MSAKKPYNINYYFALIGQLEIHIKSLKQKCTLMKT